MEYKPRIFFRADGGSTMGIGHVMRSLALAEMLSNDFYCVFITRAVDKSLKKQIELVCDDHIEVPPDLDFREEATYLNHKYLKEDDIVVLDGYHFDTSYQINIKNNKVALACIDDIHAYHFVSDVIINHSGGIDEGIYSKESYTKCYLGLKYALLRKEFRQNKTQETFESRENAIFLALGGADPNNDTLNILRSIEEWEERYKIYVVLGFSNIHKDAIRRYQSTNTMDIEILTNLDPSDMAHYMSKCKMAITPPSTVAFEYMSLGGLLLLHQIADNQKDIMSYFIEEGLAFLFDDFPIGQREIEDSLLKQKHIMDGKVHERYIEIFKNFGQK